MTNCLSLPSVSAGDLIEYIVPTTQSGDVQMKVLNNLTL